jgi:superfamily II DNA or RNA helicase
MTVTLLRENSYTRIHGCPPEIYQQLSTHLSVPIPSRFVQGKPKTDSRFGATFRFQDPITEEVGIWGSLVREGAVPSGLLPHVEALLSHFRQPFNIVDTRKPPEDQLPLWSVTVNRPRPYQDDVHRQLTKHLVGVIDAPPRSGKTLMMCRAVDTFNCKTLIVCPSRAIVKQTYEVLKSFFGDDFVARIDGGVKKEERDISKQFVVATIASAIKLPQEFFDACDALAIDEFHHGAAESYHILNAKACNIYYRWCFTGTHFRTSDDRLAMEAICSNVLYSIPVPYLVQGGWLSPARMVMSVPETPWITAKGWDDIYDQGIVNCESRNEDVRLIAQTYGLHNAVPTIVLVRRRAHADMLGEMITDSVVVKGGEDALTNDTIDGFRRGEIPIIIGTTVIGEGVDLPNAGALVYASGGGAGVQQIQSYFRPLTGGKAVAVIHDFKDRHHLTLSRHSDERSNLAESCIQTPMVKLW